MAGQELSILLVVSFVLIVGGIVAYLREHLIIWLKSIGFKLWD